MHTSLDKLPRAGLAAELLKIRWDSQGRQLEDADFEPLLDAAEMAAQRGYLRAVAAAGRGPEVLAQPEVVAVSSG